MSAHEVILLELTVCAEEGTEAAQLRKEAKYTELLAKIENAKWTARLLTLEVGARGLVTRRARHAFLTLGASPAQAKKLCRTLSEVAARCSYAICLSMGDIAGKTEVMNEAAAKTKPKPRQSAKPIDADKSIPDVAAYLSKNGVTRLFHFTDVEPGFNSQNWAYDVCLIGTAIPAKMNSDALSRDLDKARGLQDYVRLSFNEQNPMKYVAKTQKRVSKPVMLQIMLEVVTKPGVLFSDCNATRKDAVTSPNPDVVRLDIVKARNQFAVAVKERHFYQAEVLVPSPVPPELIIFPTSVAEKKQVESSMPMKPSVQINAEKKVESSMLIMNPRSKQCYE